MAAQNRISELQAAGFEDRYLYADGGTAGVVKLGQIPQDAAQDSTITADTICFVRSNDKNDKAKAALLAPERRQRGQGTVGQQLDHRI